jgi:IS30 family transposase
LSRAPYVCNGCGTKSCRQSTKYYYRAGYAHQLYTEALSVSRRGVNKTPLELDDLDRLITPLLKNGQSLNHIYATHGDEINCSRRTLYSYIEQGALTAGNMDLPRKVRYKPRKTRKKPSKNHQAYRNNRTYKDFQRYLEEYPEASVVEMDTVESSRDSHRAIFTMLFRNCSLMLAFLLEHNTQAEVGKVFETLERILGADRMCEVFQVILTDNGSEFKNPAQMEFSLSGKRRTRVFYCDPMASWQKGRLEKNHEYIRYIIPKGRSFAGLTPYHVALILNHINSTARASLNGSTPFELASLLLPPPLLVGLGLNAIPHDQIILKPRLLKDSRPR